MKVLIDMTNIRMELLNFGLQKYAIKLVSSIPPQKKISYSQLIISEALESIRKKFPYFEYIVIKKPKRRFPVLEYFFVSHKYKKIANKFDVVFISDNIAFCTMGKLRARKIIVCHDLTTIRERKKNLKSFVTVILANLYFKIQFQNADTIIAISKYVRDDIIQTFPKVRPGKIQIIYNSVSFTDIRIRPVNFNIKADFLLTVNTLLEYKNIKTLLDAYNIIRKESDILLVIVGKKTSYWNNILTPLIKKTGMEKYVVQKQDVTEPELNWLYGNARLFVTTSLHEGFGYTPIEAAINGCPVISTKCDALLDTTQNKVRYYEPPTDAIALAAEIRAELHHPQTKEKLRQTGIYFSNFYSPLKQYMSIENILFR